MFRFISFIFGIAAGFALALAVLPLPGKTFFNKMSKLPPTAKDLIDNSINLGISAFRLASTAGKEFNHRFSDVLDKTKIKIDELNIKYSEELDKFKTKRNSQTSKEEVNV